MKIKKTFWNWIIFLSIVGLIAGAGVVIWNKSIFGEPLPTTSGIDTFSHNNEAPMESQTNGANGNLELLSPICGGPAEMVVLVLGIDENEQADAIRLVKVDFVEEKVIVLSIPRDFYVPIPGFTEHGITENRVNAAYGFGEHYKVDGGGVAATANTIHANFGVGVDHYGVFHFEQFSKVIDKIGGVDITLDKAVFGVGGNPYFGEGTHHLTGATAMAFVRIRETDTDIQRIDRQTFVLVEILKKMRDTMNATQLVALGLDIINDKTILTDLNLDRLYSLACLGTSIDSEDVSFVSIPSEMYTPFTTEKGANVRIPGALVAPFIQDVIYGKSNE